MKSAFLLSLLVAFGLGTSACSDREQNKKDVKYPASSVVNPHEETKIFADKFVNNFIGHCVQNMPRIDKIEAAANALDWQEIEGDVAIMIAPQDPDTWFRAWLVEIEPGLAMMISIAKVDAKSPPSVICTVANPYAPASDIVMSLKNILKLSPKPLADEISAGQRTRVWKYDELFKGATVSVIDATPMKQSGITVAIMTSKKYK